MSETDNFNVLIHHTQPRSDWTITGWSAPPFRQPAGHEEGGLMMTASANTLDRVRTRYSSLAGRYELTLGNRLLYADMRAAAIAMLRLEAGATVVDFACGTGLNFPLIQDRIGPTGRLIGVDLTPAMLQRAAARVTRAGWSNVTLLLRDVLTLDRAALVDAGALRDGQPVDAVLCTLGMSVIPQWQAAWSVMLEILKPDGTAALMDGSPPANPTRGTKLISPLVWLGCRYFTADWDREPWKLAQRDLKDVKVAWGSWGYVSAAGGVKPTDRA